MLSQFIHQRNIYLLGLAALLFGLPISGVVVSLAQMLLAAHWLFTADFRSKWIRIKSNKTVWLLWLLYLLYAIGLLYSNEVNPALDSLRIKLPLLLLPLFVVSQKRITRKELAVLFTFFLSGVLISAGISLYQVWLNSSNITYDVRLATVLVPHIRFSLMLDLCIVWLLYYALRSKKIFHSVFYWLMICALMIVLWKIQALTGLFILPIAVFTAIILGDFGRLSIAKLKPFIISGIALISVCFVVYIYRVAQPFLKFQPADIELLETNSANGYVYLHQVENAMVENGHQVWIYITDPECRKEWNKRSTYKFDEKGSTGEPIRATLYRFLASKGNKKDSVAVSQLTNLEVQLIEQGETNVRYALNESFEKRLYQTIWELHNYFHGAGGHSGHSVAQRIEFWSTGLQVFQDAMFFGHGTGAVLSEMAKKYSVNNTELNKSVWYKPHNQFITTSVALGLFGFFALLLCFVRISLRTQNNPIHIAFVVILFLSMLTEDTIEGQIGATLFSVFYALFFCQPQENKNMRAEKEKQLATQSNV